MIENYKCCEQVYSGSPYFPYTCGKTAKVERDGKHYCGIHDPVRLAEKRRRNQKAWDAEYEAKKKKFTEEKARADEQKRRADCFSDLLQALQIYQHIVESGGVESDLKSAYENASAAIKKATE